jgi:para-nitrobenzyl esterase
VVGVEYRLGIFGFLASRRLLPNGTLGAKGNFGILDQQLGLKWVGKHIAHFSGDPKRITVVGWSAGAASISVHLAMPSSRGLFQRAIMLSGGFVAWAAQSADLAENAYDAVLQASGCGQTKGCLEEGPPCPCLLNLSVPKILELSHNYFAAPTVDGSFLPHHPIDALRLQKINTSIPIIIGSAIEDSFVDIGAHAGMGEFKAFLSTVLPDDLTAEKAYNLYMDSPSEQVLQGPDLLMHSGWSRYYWLARRVYADSVMTCPARRAAKLWRSSVGAQAYWYLWGVGKDTGLPEVPVGPGRVFPRSAKFTKSSCWPCPGAGHGADMDYFFDGKPSTTTGHKLPSQARELSTIYPALLADFAKNGDPNQWNQFSLHANDHSAWPPVHEGFGMFFAINHTLAVPDMRLRAQVCDFWDSVHALTL